MQLKARCVAFAAHFFDFLQRYPRAVALFSFVSGLASFFLVNRQHRSAALLAVVLLLGWVWLMLDNLLARHLAKRFGLEIPPALLRFATQSIHQESLFFVLPFFLVTTTWLSGQALFTGVLVLAALPVILHLTTAQTYLYAMSATVVLAIPTLLRVLRDVRRWQTWLGFVAMVTLLAGALWLGRYWVPPATLWLTEVRVSPQMDGAQKAAGVALATVDEAQLQAQGLYAYTAIRAPRGLGEQVFHVWRHEGREVDRIPLKIKGGREKGYRTWTHKTRFPARAVGRWQVQVVTAAGQMIGVVRFQVVPSG